MKNRTAYSYAILRYVHDIGSGEFINVGVAIHSAEHKYFRVLCRKNLGRLSDAFPDIKPTSFKNIMKWMNARFEQVSEMYSSSLSFDSDKPDLKKLMHSVLPHDDSSLVWSNISSGLTIDPEHTLHTLYARYVSKYDKKNGRVGRTDEDVWRSFKRSLENRRISKYFKEKVIQGQDDEVKFPLAWKNGIWHCVEPISFDLSGSDSIREKAHKFMGQIAGVSDSPEQFKLYLVVGKPTDSDLENVFERVMRLLHKMPFQTEIYLEDQKEELVEKLSSQISHHQVSTREMLPLLNSH